MNCSILYKSLRYLKSNFELTVSLSNYFYQTLEYILLNDKKLNSMFVNIDYEVIHHYTRNRCIRNSYFIYTWLHKYFEEIKVFDEQFINLFCMLLDHLFMYVKILKLVIIKTCESRHLKLLETLFEKHYFNDKQKLKMLYNVAKYNQKDLVLFLKPHVTQEYTFYIIKKLIAKRVEDPTRIDTSSVTTLELLVTGIEHMFYGNSLLMQACIQNDTSLSLYLINKTDDIILLNRALGESKKLKFNNAIVQGLINKGATRKQDHEDDN